MTTAAEPPPHPESIPAPGQPAGMAWLVDAWFRHQGIVFAVITVVVVLMTLVFRT